MSLHAVANKEREIVDWKVNQKSWEKQFDSAFHLQNSHGKYITE